MIKLTWMPRRRAYSVRRYDRVIGIIRCALPLPFRGPVEFT